MDVHHTIDLVLRHLAPMRPSRSRTRSAQVALTVGGLVTAALAAASVPPAQAAPLNDCVSADNGYPAVSLLEVTPNPVDVRVTSRTLRIRMEVEDRGGPGPASGVAGVWVGLGGAPGVVKADGFPTTRLARTSTGAWVGSFVVPRGSRRTLRLGATLVDRAGNMRWLDTADLATAGFSPLVTVLSRPDRTSPRLTSLHINPAVLDTRTSPAAVTITATAHDRRSGVRAVRIHGLGKFTLARVPGSRATFSGTQTVGVWARSGARHITTVSVEDRVGHVHEYADAALRRAGFDRSLTVLSRHDTRPPVIGRMSVSPSAVDVRTADRTVTVRVRAHDRQAGVRSVTAILDSRGQTPVKQLRLVTGTARRGAWEAQVLLPRCQGWHPSEGLKIVLVDNAGNQARYGSVRLVRHGWPGRISITALDHIPPSVDAFFEPGTPLAPISLTFSEAVNGITSESAVVRSRIDEAGNLGSPIAGTWRCQDARRTVTSCETGAVLSARFVPEQPLATTVAVPYTVTLNPESTLALTDLAGNPFRDEELFLQCLTSDGPADCQSE